jgi:hypothetical protein
MGLPVLKEPTVARPQNLYTFRSIGLSFTVRHANARMMVYPQRYFTVATKSMKLKGYSHEISWHVFCCHSIDLTFLYIRSGFFCF